VHVHVQNGPYRDHNSEGRTMTATLIEANDDVTMLSSSWCPETDTAPC
jgi:hypothetical protein